MRSGEARSVLAIGIDIGGTNIRAGVVADGGRIVARLAQPTDAVSGADRVVAHTCELIEQLRSLVSGKRIDAIGVGTPGYVDAHGRSVGGAPNLPGWEALQVSERLRACTGTPVFVANDVSLAAYGEFALWQAEGVSTLALFNIGTGIGGGLVIGGSLYLGRNSMAGELGHMCVEIGGAQCACGARGCLEAYASAVGMVRYAREFCAETAKRTPFVDFVDCMKVGGLSPCGAGRGGNGAPATLSPEIIYGFVRHGDEAAVEFNVRLCEMIGAACGTLANIMAPDVVLLGGGVMRSADLMLPEVRKHFAAYCKPGILAGCRLEAARSPVDNGILGAGLYALELIGANS